MLLFSEKRWIKSIQLWYPVVYKVSTCNEHSVAWGALCPTEGARYW